MTDNEMEARLTAGTATRSQIADHYKVSDEEVARWLSIADTLDKQAKAGAPELAELSLNDLRMAVVTMEGDVGYV